MTAPVARAESESDCFADLACAAWKCRKQVLTGLPAKPAAEVQQINDQFEALWEHLSVWGICIEDHTGEPFQEGWGLEVLAFEPASDLARPAVVETLRPTVWLSGKRILNGLVVVGTPPHFQDVVALDAVYREVTGMLDQATREEK